MRYVCTALFVLGFCTVLRAGQETVVAPEGASFTNEEEKTSAEASKSEEKSRAVTEKKGGSVVSIPRSRYEKLKAKEEAAKRAAEEAEKQAEEKPPEPTETPEYKALAKVYEQACAALQAKSYAKALRLFERVVKEAPPPPEEPAEKPKGDLPPGKDAPRANPLAALGEKAREQINVIEAGAEQALNEGDNLYAGPPPKLFEAACAWEDVATTFRGTAAAKAAGERLSKLKQNPELAPALELATAANLEKNKDYRKAYNTYERVLRGYPNTPQADKAKERMDLLLEKGLLSGTRLGPEEEKEALKWYTIGRIHLANKRFEQAREWFAKVVETYNGSTIADMADEAIQSTYAAQSKPAQ